MASPPLVVRVAPELAFLLRPRERAARERRLGYDPDATVGHVVQAAGVPLTEVGELRLDGVPTGLSARPGPGAVVEVAAVPRPQPVPPGGFLPELAERAAAEERALLTQDRGLLKRRGVRGALVRGSRPDDQLADVLDRFAPELAPLTRCTACGARLEPVPKAEVADRLPAGTRRTVDEFSRCPACGRLYWRGAHAPRINALIWAAQRG